MKWYLDGESRRDELRAAAPDHRGHKARKDRRKWCRGRVGVPHSDPLGRRVRIEPTWVPADRPRCFRPDWRPEFWWCHHEDYCTKCGKVLRRDLGRECPDFTAEVTMFRDVFKGPRRS